MEFTWDPAKRIANLAKHGIDFRRERDVFDGRCLYSFASPRVGEARFVSVGLVDGSFVSVVWLDRNCERRVISMRRARRGEESEYRKLYG